MSPLLLQRPSRKSRLRRESRFSWSLIFVGFALVLLSVSQLLYSPRTLSSNAARSDDKTKNDGLDFWWMLSLKNTALRFHDSDRTLVFPPSINRLWVDVGVHKESDFIIDLEEDHNKDLFVIGFEPSHLHKPCPHDRCVVLWAACTPDYDVVNLNVQEGNERCDSLLRPNKETATHLWRGRGCVTQRKDPMTGKPMRVQVPGVPLRALVNRVPHNVNIEYIKIDAQGYDLEVMKGALATSDRIEVVSLEAMDVDDSSKLLYFGEPMLKDIIETLKAAGWIYVRSVDNRAAKGQVNAFFVSDIKYTAKVDSLAEVLMPKKKKK